MCRLRPSPRVAWLTHPEKSRHRVAVLCWGATKASNHSLRRHADHDVQTVIPADPIAKTTTGFTRYPVATSAVNVTGGTAHNVQGFIYTLACSQATHQMMAEPNQPRHHRPHQPIEETAVRYARKRCSPVPLGIGIEFSVATKARSATLQARRQHFTHAQAGRPVGQDRPINRARFAIIVSGNKYYFHAERASGSMIVLRA